MTMTLCRDCGRAIAEDDEMWEGWLHFIKPDDDHAAEPKKWIREDW